MGHIAQRHAAAVPGQDRPAHPAPGDERHGGRFCPAHGNQGRTACILKPAQVFNFVGAQGRKRQVSALDRLALNAKRRALNHGGNIKRLACPCFGPAAGPAVGGGVQLLAKVLFPLFAVAAALLLQFIALVPAPVGWDHGRCPPFSVSWLSAGRLCTAGGQRIFAPWQRTGRRGSARRWIFVHCP